MAAKKEKAAPAKTGHSIRVGVGGWNFDPWNETFYPANLPKKKQLEYASRQLTTIEINGTFYRTQSPETYQKWAAETPEDFVFAVKAHNYCMSRKTPEEMKDSINHFIGSGVSEMGARLGPINWQFHPSKKFVPEYFESFFSLLPKEHKGVKLRHAIEVRHESFATDEFTDLLRKHGCALVSADDDDWPQADRETADFAYARLQRTKADEKTGYPTKEIDAWAKTLKGWAQKRDVFAFFISGAKERNPAAAMAMIAKL